MVKGRLCPLGAIGLPVVKLFISVIWPSSSSVFKVENTPLIEAKGKGRGLLQTTQSETTKCRLNSAVYLPTLTPHHLSKKL